MMSPLSPLDLAPPLLILCTFIPAMHAGLSQHALLLPFSSPLLSSLLLLLPRPLLLPRHRNVTRCQLQASISQRRPLTHQIIVDMDF